MRKTTAFYCTLSILSVLLLSSCANKDSKDSVATISIQPESERTNTLKQLNLGELFDFDFKVNRADETWVTVWLERYTNGKQQAEPMLELSYGNSPNKTETGNMGFGIIHTDDANRPLAFLYAPNVATTPQSIEKVRSEGTFNGWEYAIDEGKVELNIGETYLLGAYRESKGNSIRTYDLQDEKQVKKMIQDDKTVLLLKVKIEEN